MQEKDIFGPPEFKVRAGIFANRVKTVGARIREEYRMSSYFTLKVEESLQQDMDRLANLARIIPGSDNLGGLNPRLLADELDRETAGACVIGVDAIADDRRVLKEFVEETLALAAELRGALDDSYNPLVSTEDETDHIVDMGREWSYLLASRMFFTFS